VAVADGLPSEPQLRLDPGGHTAIIRRIDADAAGRFLVTGSDDKTVRVWAAEDGRLLRTLRVPAGRGNLGKVYAVAVSPDGERVAAGGWGRLNDNDVYLFETVTGRLLARAGGLPNVVHHLAFAPDGRRLVATLANPKGVLWRVPTAEAGAGTANARRVALTTSNGSAPRWDGQRLLYVSSRGSGDTVWGLEGDRATALWSAPDARIVDGPAIAPDGGRVAFAIDRQGQTALIVVNVDGSEARVVSTPGQVQGPPAWRPDGRAVTVAAVVDGEPRLFNVPLDGGPPVSLVHEYAVHPAWSPDGDFVLYSGPDVGTTFAVKAAAADGGPYPLPPLTLTRGARRLRVTEGRRVMVLRGEIGHKDLWLVDLATGAERQVTHLPAGFAVRDFDVSTDGREIVLEQIQEQSDIVLLEMPQ
jgi:Tol biopolymer transport system component